MTRIAARAGAKRAARSAVLVGYSLRPRALSMMLQRRILVRVETLERRVGRPVPAVMSAEARALLDAVLVGLYEPRLVQEKDRDGRP